VALMAWAARGWGAYVQAKPAERTYRVSNSLRTQFVGVRIIFHCVPFSCCWSCIKGSVICDSDTWTLIQLQLGSISESSTIL
jgi:hypothetical protein